MIVPNGNGYLVVWCITCYWMQLGAKKFIIHVWVHPIHYLNPGSFNVRGISPKGGNVAKASFQLHHSSMGALCLVWTQTKKSDMRYNMLKVVEGSHVHTLNSY